MKPDTPFGFDFPVLKRSALPFEQPVEIFDFTNDEWTTENLHGAWNDGSLIIEARQPPSLFGIGEIEGISNDTILAGSRP